ncbi:hypothetical protein GJ496_001509 [Pomphorhynchus laevis]|nr:hypothetical protein GJ496_001509 [Pomphorhynchus laevis]
MQFSYISTEGQTKSIASTDLNNQGNARKGKVDKFDTDQCSNAFENDEMKSHVSNSTNLTGFAVRKRRSRSCSQKTVRNAKNAVSTDEKPFDQSNRLSVKHNFLSPKEPIMKIKLYGSAHDLHSCVVRPPNCSRDHLTYPLNKNNMRRSVGRMDIQPPLPSTAAISDIAKSVLNYISNSIVANDYNFNEHPINCQNCVIKTEHAANDGTVESSNTGVESESALYRSTINIEINAGNCSGSLDDELRNDDAISRDDSELSQSGLTVGNSSIQVPINGNTLSNSHDQVTFQTYTDYNFSQDNVSSEQIHEQQDDNLNDNAFNAEHQCQTKYKELEIIHVSNRSVIYKALDLTTQRVIAVKNIHLFETTNGGLPAGLIREVGVMQQIKDYDHHFLLGIKDVDVMMYSQSSVFSIIMDYFPYNLAGYISTHPIISSRIQMSISVQLVEAIEFLHNRRIVHRRISPDHVLVNPVSNYIKLTGFKCARPFEHIAGISSYDKNRGRMSPVQSEYYEYQSPEILLGYRSYSEKVDVWSCGCILSFLHTKKILFPGNSPIDILTVIFRSACSPYDAKILEGMICEPIKLMSELIKKDATSYCCHVERELEGNSLKNIISQMLNLNSFCRPNITEVKRFCLVAPLS